MTLWVGLFNFPCTQKNYRMKVKLKILGYYKRIIAMLCDFLDEHSNRN